jgi:hypothetical protein
MAGRDEARRDAGREALRAAGIADEETTPDALIAFAGRTVELDLALIERLAGTPSDAAAVALRTLESAAERSGRKAVVKEARRALYRFGQRGIAVPAPPPAEPATRRTAAPPVEGYVSSIDGRGDRLVWVVRPQRGGGLVVLTAVLNEPGGLRDVAIAELPRKTLRRMERDLQARHGLRMVAADGLYCDALLGEGFARARDAGTPGVGEYPTLRARLLTTEPAPRDPPLADRVVATAAADAADAVARGATLLDAPEFRTWRLERATLAPYLTEIAAARESPLVLSRPQQEDRVRAAMLRAVRELFTGESGSAYRRRLEEMAYYLFATQRRELAVTALATARALAAGSAGGEGIPFFEELTRRSIAVLAEEDAARAHSEAEQSVLIRPGAPTAAGRPRGPLR